MRTTIRARATVDLGGKKLHLLEHRGRVADLQRVYRDAAAQGWKRLRFNENGNESELILARETTWDLAEKPLPAYAPETVPEQTLLAVV